MIDKLVASADNRTPEISVQTGTIHGFQGDECDIIIAVFNPPPTLSTSPRLFLNKQNILNVAISRAKNYLFLLVPDHRTLNVDKLYNLRIIRSLVSKFAEGDNAIWEAEDVERRIFKTPQYILDNVFTTTHQSVNVYARSEKLYEIRTEDTAIDIQLKN